MTAGAQRLLVPRVSRAELVARELEREIVDEREPGGRLGTKEDLRQRFGVAVATVNEALQLLEVRDALEPLIASHAARYHRAGDIRELNRIVKSMEKAEDDPAAFFKHNWALHRRIAGLCRNTPLRSMYLALIDFLEHSVEEAEFARFDGDAIVAIHRELVGAIDAGEGPRLEAAIEAHQQTPARTA
jgi:DNA-binding FadR family transcriptional regulator